MPRPPRRTLAGPTTKPRKLPVQARSTKLVEHILEAAVRVLAREGPDRFTTIRVAATAGVSVGSLYQYFPNKQSILFRLQTDEWEKTGSTIEAILHDPSRPPAERLRAMIHAFFVSECEEAPLRRALDAAALGYRSSAEAEARRARSTRIVRLFVAEAAPRLSAGQRAFAADMLIMTLTSIGKRVSERAATPPEVARWADATTDMILGWLASLAPTRRHRPPAPRTR